MSAIKIYYNDSLWIVMWDHRPLGRFAPHDKICDILRAALKVGLYFRRRQALWHAFVLLSNAYKSVLRRICLYFSRRHHRASTRARKRSSAQDAAKFNGAELSRFKVGLYFWRSQAPLTQPRSALVCGISWRVPIGVSMRKRLSKKYKPTRVHKRWQKLNDFQDTGLNNV